MLLQHLPVSLQTHPTFTMRIATVPTLLFFLVSLFFSAGALHAQDASVTGVVNEERSGQPLPGVTVLVEELGIGSATNIDGIYEITGLEPGTYSVRFSFVGFRPQTETVSLDPGQELTLDVTLQEAALDLEEVVVTGTGGETRRRELGTTIARITPGDIDEPVMSIEDLMQGRVTGMTVNPGSGTQGAGAAIRLRGNVSMTQSNQPLIYIDGIRQGADSFPLNSSDGAGFWQTPQSTSSPLGNLNANDIASIDIVRGPSATTLFGSEAAAGVIQVFTRTGHDGPARWNYQSTHRFDQVQDFGSDVRPTINMDPFLKTAYGQRHNLSVSGGRSDIRYFVSGVFEDADGIHPNDSERQFGFRTNVSFQPAENLWLDLRSSWNNRDMTITHVGNNLFGIQFNAFRSPSNTVGSGDPEVIGRLLDAVIFQENTRLTSGLTARWAPIENLDTRLTVGIDRLESDMKHETPFGFILEPGGSIGEQMWVNQSLSVDVVSNYRFSIAENWNQRVSFGGQWIDTEDQIVDGFGRGLPGPGNLTVSAAADRLAFSNEFRITRGGVFGETLFDWHDRYFLTLAARVDGQSTFGDDFGLQVYPKAGFSYVVSDEDFWNWDAISSFRLRTAIGQAGRAPGAFDAVRTFTPRSFGGQSAFRPANVGNPNLGPETTTELEVGAEASFLGDRVVSEVTYFHQWTNDALFAVPQEPSRGFSGTQLENIGSLENRGVEFELNALLVERGEFAFDVGASFSTLFSEITDTGGEVFNTVVEGQPAPVMRGTRVVNADEIADPEFERDAFFGPTAPEYRAALELRFGLPRGIRLTTQGEFQGGHYIEQSSQWAMVNRGAGAPGCDGIYQSVPHGEYSTAAADQAGISAFNRAHCFSEHLTDGLWIEPADFLKLRHITLHLPLSFLAQDLVRDASLNVSARNIRLWSNVSAFDPEMIWSRAGLTALNPGIPETTPSPMRFSISLNVDF